ncbi:hypothetical protein NDU88_001885 [Pleurodeles waltl]|uniref:Uncharacterized protein n=1 Tax=Pleurodeles waltl TaxID=8319 RepID=A0AAV7KU09_PLEWA|nr:hypothetical protein NDU88_001885 [Pleurodeles waltl]
MRRRVRGIPSRSRSVAPHFTPSPGGSDAEVASGTAAALLSADGEIRLASEVSRYWASFARREFTGSALAVRHVPPSVAPSYGIECHRCHRVEGQSRGLKSGRS